MVHSSCFVPGCTTGYPSDRKRCKRDGEKVKSMFLAPADTETFEKWKKAVPRQDRELSRENRVCELHFLEEDIDKYYTTVMPDGSVDKMEKGRPTLKKGSVPCIFPNLPKYLSKTNKKRKLPADRKSGAENKKAKISSESCSFSVEVNEITDVVDNSPDFNFRYIFSNCDGIKRPSEMWGITQTSEFLIYSKWTSDFLPERWIVIRQDLSINVFICGSEINLPEGKKVNSLHDISLVIQLVDNLILCAGIQLADCKPQEKCMLYLSERKSSKGRYSPLCEECRKAKKRLANLTRNPKRCVRNYKKLRQNLVSSNRRNIRLKRKITKLSAKVSDLKKKCAVTKMEAIEQSIKDLPPIQKQSIQSCIEIAQTSAKQGRRYNLQWIYECLLIRIKSAKLYEHLRSREILPLPSSKTISRYIKKIKGIYGFQKPMFDCLKKKSAVMDKSDRRGTLLIDEMKVSETLEFNRETLEFKGFTDLGDLTPDDQKSLKGDHALVLMFQPFRGKWIQAIACFLSKGAASGSILHKLAMECIILLENSGFFVDAVTTDGAQWNRNMWIQFGINLKNISCEHPADKERRLWFISDFPHLLKNIRNVFTDKRLLMTPDGVIDLAFWEAIVAFDNPSSLKLKICPSLTMDHLQPKHYQKMNVRMAFQFFGHSVATAMEGLKEHIPELEGSEGCIAFIKRMNEIMNVMNSRIPSTALRTNSDAEEAIIFFMLYLDNWEAYAKQKKSAFLSDSTAYGLQVTLKATLEILHFLVSKCGYDYLMTSRLNQDSLERFFSMMRHASGCNDHPDSVTFIQLFKLLSTYSLVKPPRGSNISGGGMLKTIMETKDLMAVQQQQESFNAQLLNILKSGSDVHIFDDIDHNYMQQNSAECIVAYVSGFVAWRAQKFTNCEICRAYLLATDEESSHYNLIDVRAKKALTKPSAGLFKLISAIETTLMDTVSRQGIQVKLMADVLTALEEKPSLALIGCLDHQLQFTHKIAKYYLLTRMHFFSKRANEIDNARINKTRELRKMAKLA